MAATHTGNRTLGVNTLESQIFFVHLFIVHINQVSDTRFLEPVGFFL
jgi:hypothetical protein